MADAEPRPKRSRFDQTEPEPRRTSRFDRRSRSPPSRKSEPGRDRSPLPRADDEAKKSEEPSTAALDPAAAAAAAAAKINAQLQARKGVQNADSAPAKSASSTGPITSASSAAKINGEMYVADGDYIKDIEVNDLRNRYLLTKSATQKMIKEETGADVTTRGNYYPDKSMSTPAIHDQNPPLYLHVTSTSKEGLEAAVAKIEELMKQELPQLVDERRFRRREEPVVERDEYGRRKWPEERIPIGLEPIPGFNLRAQVVGHGGSYVKHIQQETGCRVQIKGRGSGFLETATGKESDDEMFLHVAGPDPKMVEKGKEMCEDLLASVKEQYEEFKARPPRFGGDRFGGDRYNGGGDRHGSGDRYGGDRRGGDRYGGDRHGGDRGHQGYGGHGHGHGRSPGVHGAPSGPSGGHGNQGIFSPGGAAASPAAAVATGAQATPDYSAAYAQYYGGQDPYAAYGGYAAYVQMYQQYYAQAGQQGATAGAPGAPGAPGASSTPSAAPPPPPSDAAPPPPPPPSAAPPPPPPGPPGASGGYSAVPPPPGL
ncbi:hypothetical protein M0657_003695 [Pyricularia oryzae]|nr:hypothetical protein M9X92_005005 [Pyricularia oryzae]KAI7926462.1 hypothetical protein M0657_003695 [Pyricularia oryzae]